MKRLTDKQFTKLIQRAAATAAKHSAIQKEVTEAFEARYGTTHSEVDCDQLIDLIEYGGWSLGLSAEFADEQMALCGAPKLKGGA